MRAIAPALLVSLLMASTAAAQADDGDLKRLWQESPSRSWNHGVAVAPWGDVLISASDDVTVLAREDGRSLTTFEVCRTSLANAIHFFDDNQAAIICRHRLIRLSPLEGEQEPGPKWPDPDGPSAVASSSPEDPSGERLAVGFRSGTVQVMKPGTWTVTWAHQFDDPVTALAVSPDGTEVAVGLSKGQIVRWRLEDGEHTTLLPNNGSTCHALAYDREGKRLFGEAGSFEARIWALDSGRVEARFVTGSWLKAAAFLADGSVVATGSQGLVRYTAGFKRGDPLSRDLGEGLGVSPKGDRVCAGGTDGQIGCWSSKSVSPSIWGDVAQLPFPTRATKGPQGATLVEVHDDDDLAAQKEDDLLIQDATVGNATLLTWSVAALVGGPTSIYLISDGVTPDQATLLSVACAGGAISMGMGAILIGAGVVSVVLSPIIAIFDGEAGAGMALAGLLMGGLGIGLVALSPVIIGVGTFEAESRYGDRPRNVVALSLTTALTAGLSASAAAYAVEEIQAEPWIKVLAVGATSLLVANVTYATFRRVSEDDSGAAPPPMMMSPLVQF